MTNPNYDMEALAELGEDYLQHYGVKGMKWGVRKASSAKAKVSSAAAATKKAASDPEVQKAVLRAATISGGAVVAGMLAGPVGSVTVSTLGKAFATKTSSSYYVTDGQGNSYGDASLLEDLQ